MHRSTGNIHRDKCESPIDDVKNTEKEILIKEIQKRYIYKILPLVCYDVCQSLTLARICVHLYILHIFFPMLLNSLISYFIFLVYVYLKFTILQH